MKLRRGVALAVTMALVVVACGGADGGGSGDGGSDGGATPATVTASEFAFDPVDLSVAANTDVDVTLKNGGAIDHEWVVLKKGTTISKETEFEESMVELRIDAIGAGAEASKTLNLPAGDYQVICALIGHLNAGMKGTLKVGG